MDLFYFALAGIGGALVKDIIKDGSLCLPKVKDGKFYLGFLGSAFIGAWIGYLVDNTVLISFLSGYVGFSVFEDVLLGKLLPVVKKLKDQKNGESIRDNNTSGS